jgi:hypothetical protein
MSPQPGYLLLGADGDWDRAAEGGVGVYPISINLTDHEFLKSLELTWSLWTIFHQRFGNVSASTQQMSQAQRHLQHIDHTIADLFEDQPPSLLAAPGNPRGKKNARHESCAR